MWQFYNAHVIPARHHVLQKALNLLFHLVIGVELPFWRLFLELVEKVVVTLCRVQTLWRVGDNIPTIDGLMGHLWMHVVVESAYALAQHL